jgi:hypothetical protein
MNYTYEKIKRMKFEEILQHITTKFGFIFRDIDTKSEEATFDCGNYKMTLKPSKSGYCYNLFYKRGNEKAKRTAIHNNINRTLSSKPLAETEKIFTFLKVYDFFYNKINDNYDIDDLSVKFEYAYNGYNSLNSGRVFERMKFCEKDKTVFSILDDPEYRIVPNSYARYEKTGNTLMSFSFQYNNVQIKRGLYFDNIDFNFYWDKIVSPVIETRLNIAKLHADLTSNLEPIKELVESDNFLRIVKTNNLDVTLNELED